MRTPITRWFVLLLAVSVVFGSALLVAQAATKDDKKEDDESADEAETVYTTDDLEDQDAKTGQAVTNKTLEEKYGTPTSLSGSAFTNEDLRKLFGDKAAPGPGAAAEADPAAAADPAEPAAAAEPAPAAEPAAPLTPAERADRIAKIEALIAALQQELDQLRGEAIPEGP